MTDHPYDDPGHDALNCVQCQAYNEAGKVIGGIVEVMQRMTDDGTFERMGREMAERREAAVLKAFLETK